MNGDDRKLWNEINWAGKYKSRNENPIHIDTMADYFENLYEPLDKHEKVELNELHTDVYMPVTDDPITVNEITDAVSETKKGGYDYSLSVLNLFVNVLLPFFTLFFNMCFYMSYPVKLALSMLCAIPKKGNLRLATNYRGIQLQPLIATLYDRILNNRLQLWANFSPEQSAFQKGKGTLDQIFLLRTVISLVKHSKAPLFIGFFDLAKAFDKVSRTLLLKSLIKIGIGSSMFYAIKSMYSVTKCVLKTGEKLSEIFQTHTGIKQGAPSSVTLFLIFMDGFIAVLREKCVEETIIENLHILLHADDTIVLSTKRDLFIEKCNILIAAFTAKKLSLNIGKSGFMVINPSNPLDRVDIKLAKGWLCYTKVFVYLGVTFSDQGTIAEDIRLHVESKSKSVFIKLANFMRNNTYAPITVKSKVLKACLRAAILYGHEAWGSCSLQKVETLYRKAIRITFSIQTRTPNEMLYIETGIHELKAEIYKSQHKFWSKIKNDIENNTDCNMAKLYRKAIDVNTTFLRHYKKLHSEFKSHNDCFRFHRKQFIDSCTETIRSKAAKDPLSVYDDYVLLNGNLTSPLFYTSYTVTEYDRIIITKYRTGSHYLKMQAGRTNNTNRNQRLCKCKELQTLKHVIFECFYTVRIRTLFPTTNIRTLEEFFQQDPTIIATALSTIEHTLQLR